MLEPIQLGPGSACPVSRGGHVTGKSGHARTCSGETDDVISSAGARGGALLRSTVPARGPGPWERTRMGTSGEPVSGGSREGQMEVTDSEEV